MSDDVAPGMSRDEYREILRSVLTERASILALVLDELRLLAGETYPRQREALLNLIDLAGRRVAKGAPP